MTEKKITKKTEKPKKQRKQRKSGKSSQSFKKNLLEALYSFYAISSIFLLLFSGSLMFLLFQWKNYKITEYIKEIQQSRTEVLKLKSEISYNQGKINTSLMKYHHIAKVAKQRLALISSVQEPVVLTVDKDRFAYYAEKDQQEDR